MMICILIYIVRIKHIKRMSKMKIIREGTAAKDGDEMSTSKNGINMLHRLNTSSV
jgi:hypothetical protein